MKLCLIFRDLRILLTAHFGSLIIETVLNGVFESSLWVLSIITNLKSINELKAFSIFVPIEHGYSLLK